MTPPPATQNLNAALSGRDGRSAPSASSEKRPSPSSIKSSSPPVRIIGTGRRSYSGGYRINV